MKEQPPRSEVSHVHSEDLPTTTEIAQRGVQEYLRILPLLPHEVRQSFAEDRDIRGCFVGAIPLLGGHSDTLFTSFSDAEVENVTETFDNKNFFVLSHTFEIFEGEEVLQRVFGNREALSRVMTLHSQYFPSSAAEDPQAWLQEHLGELIERTDDLAVKRMGLLSGISCVGCGTVSSI